MTPMEKEAMARRIARNIRREIVNADTTQAKLARATGIPESGMSLYCNAKRVPTLSKLVDIARALGCDMHADLLRGVGERTGHCRTPAGDVDVVRLACAYGLRDSARPIYADENPLWEEDMDDGDQED